MKLCWIDGNFTVKAENGKELEFLLSIDSALKELQNTEPKIRIEGCTFDGMTIRIAG